MPTASDSLRPPTDSAVSRDVADPRWIGLLLLGLILWLLLSITYKGAVNPDSPITGVDFRVYYHAAERLVAGESLYVQQTGTEGGYLYTPLLAWLIQPLARLPFATALKIWFAINTLTLLAAIGLSALALRLRWSDTARVALMVLIAFRFWPTVMSFGYGQVNFALVAVIAGMMLAAQRQSWWAFGLMLALGAMIKPWMIGLLLYPAVFRKWSALAWSLVATAALMAGAFALVGFAEWPRFLHVLATNSEQSGLVSQSILGFARLHFAPNILVEPFTTDAAVKWGFVGAGALAVFGALGWLWLRPSVASPYEERLRFGFTTVSLLLLLPLCHSEYFMLLLPLLWTLLLSKDAPRAARVIGIGVALFAYVLLTRPWPTCGPALVEHRAGWKSLLVSSQFYIACGLWLSSYFLLLRLRTRQLAEVPAVTNPHTLAPELAVGCK